MCAPRSIHVAIPAPRSHVAKCSIFVARDPSQLLSFATHSSLTRRRHPPARSRTHPRHARTHRHRKRSVIAFSLFHAQPPRAAPTTLAFCGTSDGFLFLLQGSHPFLGRPFFLSFCFALRRAPRQPARKNKLSSAHTDDRRTSDTTCGPQAWLTGTLHDRGIRSVRSPPRRAPLLATPIAKPLQCGRP